MIQLAGTSFDLMTLGDFLKQVSELGSFQVVLGAAISIVTTIILETRKKKKEDRAIKISILNKYNHCIDLILKTFVHFASQYQEMIIKDETITPIGFPHLSGPSVDHLKFDINELRYLYDLRSKDKSMTGYIAADLLKDLFSAHNMIVDFNEKYAQVRGIVLRHTLQFDKGHLLSKEANVEAKHEQLVPIKIEMIEGRDYILNLIGIGKRTITDVFKYEERLTTLINNGKNPFILKELGEEFTVRAKEKLEWLSMPESKFSDPFA